MTASHELEVLKLVNSTNETSKDEEFIITLFLSDIINIWKQYNRLGWTFKNQM